MEIGIQARLTVFGDPPYTPGWDGSSDERVVRFLGKGSRVDGWSELYRGAHREGKDFDPFRSGESG